ncbi:MAG TPA: alcohol dehydrogenase catalytic domain-containing protein [Methanosarcina sp.]|nr:alcohol dehydrogenase catalytic domain-containing protein [Methanosarcina sp.]
MTFKAYAKLEKKPGFTLIEKKIDSNLNPHEVLIKVLSVSLCGTDVHIYNWDNWAQKRIKPPLVIGHEFAGKVIKIGRDVTRVKVGDVVASETHIVCGKCEFCRKGMAHICENTKIIGVDVDGAFAEYIKMPEDNLFVDTSGMDPKYLSVLEPLGNAVHTVYHFETKLKDVAVVGCGPIGLMGIDLLKAIGAKKIIAIETIKQRLDLAKQLGADVVIDAKNEDVVERVLAETDGRGVDVVCEFSGNEGALRQAVSYVKKGGAISLLGVFSEEVKLDLNEMIFKGITAYGVTV